MSKEYSRQEVIEYARQLYMVPGKDGKHKYPVRKIAKMANKKFDDSYTYGAIQTWASKKQEDGSTWRTQYAANIAAGIRTSHIYEGKKNGLTVDESCENEHIKHIRETADINHKSNTYATNFLITWQELCEGELKRLAKKYDNNNFNIPKEEFDGLFSQSDKNMVLEIKRNTDSMLEKLRNAGKENMDKLALLSEQELSAEVKRLIEYARSVEDDDA